MAARASRTAASTNANFSRAVRSGAKSWVELGGLGFKMPNVRANPDRGGEPCKAGRRRWYRWRRPALQGLP